MKFHVEGEGRLLGDASILANPAPVKWGTAPVLIQSTLKPGKIKVIASVLFEGSQMPTSAVLELVHTSLWAEAKTAETECLQKPRMASKLRLLIRQSLLIRHLSSILP